ncbi:MAG: peptidase [Hyphomonadaceae bacterium]
MTYCVGMCLGEGVVMLADTRTNAGLDNVATFSKMHVFEAPGERVVAVMTAGNLAITQTVVSLIAEGLENKETGVRETLWDMASMFDTARFVGRAVREVYDKDAAALEARGVSFDASFLVAGQLQGRRMRLFQVYAAGNFIESSRDTPFLQIGEHKYGKPILDRVCHYDTPLREAVTLAMISMDSTLRSNLSVGLPMDLAVFRRDAIRIEARQRIGEDDPYFRMIRDRWSNSLRQAYQELPSAPWIDDPDVAPGAPRAKKA